MTASAASYATSASSSSPRLKSAPARRKGAFLAPSARARPASVRAEAGRWDLRYVMLRLQRRVASRREAE